MKRRSVICLVVLLVGFTSCSISMEKRRYRPGYHVDVVTTKHQTIHNRIKENPISRVVFDQGIIETPQMGSDNKEPGTGEVSVTEKTFAPDNPVKKTTPAISIKKNPMTDSCDIVVLVTGEKVNAKVIEMTDEYVHYKLCDDLKGRLYTVKLRSIDNITFRNGEVFVSKGRSPAEKERFGKRADFLFPASVISLCFAFLGFILSFFISPFSYISFALLILTGIFSFVLALMDVKPGRYVPSYKTRLTWIFYLLVLLLVIAGITLVFV